MTYQVRIEGGGLTLEQEVGEEIGRKIVVLIMTEGQGHTFGGPVAPLQGMSASQGSRRDEETADLPEHSIREYLLSCNAKRNPDKITAIGQYQRKVEGRDTFTRDEVLRKFEEAAEPVPKNLARDMKWALQIGWIAPKTGENNTYYVTTTGMAAVEAGFPKELRRKTSQTGRPRRKTQKKSER